MLDAGLLPLGRDHPLRRFWKSARGFWHSSTALLAWDLIALLIAVTVLQILVQYRLNLWNRDFFNALEFRDGGEIWHRTHLLVLFAAMSIGLAVTAAWGRMTFQRSWRAWVSRHLIAAWLGDERYRRKPAGRWATLFANGSIWPGNTCAPPTSPTANTLLAPVVGLILCVPHYIQGTMLLGDVIQAAAAFVAVQGAFNWLIDNFPRLAECLSSANRVGNLLTAFDRLEPAKRSGG